MTQFWSLSFPTISKHSDTALYLLLDNTVPFDITVIPYDEGKMIEIFKDDLEGEFNLYGAIPSELTVREQGDQC